MFTVSCTFSSRKEQAPSVCLAENESQALFVVDKVQGKFVKSPDLKEDNLPSKFTLEFTACVKDSIKKQPMRNSPFAIHTFHSENIPKESVRNKLCEDVEWGCIPTETNSDGCLEWTEPYSFPLPAEQKWIEFKRVITHRTGTRVIPMMVNPWIPDTQVVDLRSNVQIKRHYLAGRESFHLHKAHESSKESKEESKLRKCIEEGSLEEAFKYLGGTEEKAFLWADEIEISPSFKGKPERFNDPSYDYKKEYKICSDKLTTAECVAINDYDREGGFLNLNLKIPIRVISENESGRISPLGAHADEFAVTFYLVSQVTSSKGREDYMLHRPVPKIRKTVTIAETNYIHLDNAWVHIPYETTEGTSTLLLKIEAIGGGEKMDSFYGVYEINDTPISNFHHFSDTLSLKSSEDTSEKSVDLEKHEMSNVEAQKERIEEYKKIFDKFDKDPSAYARERPRVGQDGFDYSKGLALDLSRMRFARVKASGESCESPVERTVVYLGEVCLKDPRTDDEFSNTVVTVMAQDMEIDRDRNTKRIVVTPMRKEDIIVDNKMTNEFGCVQFTYEVSHKLYDVQKYFMKKLTFKVHDVEDSKYIALNPWEYGFLTYQEFTQAYENWEASKRVYDEAVCGENKECLKNIEKALIASEKELTHPAPNNNRRVESRYKDCQQRECAKLQKLEKDLTVSESQLASPIFSENLEPPILRLNEYRNAIIEPSYEIEPSLDVQTVKNMQLLLQPTIVRQDSPGETIRQIPRILPIGYYLVRVIVAKGPQETAEGKKFIIDRLGSVQSAVRLVTDLRLSNVLKRFGSVVDTLTVPTRDVSADSLYFDDLDTRAKGFEQSGTAALEKLSKQFEKSIKALEELSGEEKFEQSVAILEEEFEQSVTDLTELREDQSYDVYRQHSKTANAKEFFSDGCQEGDRLPCFAKEDYITHFDTLAYVENGVLNAFVKLGFNVEHFRHLGSKNSVLIEIYPTDPREYQYLDIGENGSSNRCNVDIENTTFIPFPQCERGKLREDCHELKTPAHWGLFFNTEFGNANITWPIKQGHYNKVFGLDKKPIKVEGKNWYHLTNEINRVGLVENALSFSNHPIEVHKQNWYRLENERGRLANMESNLNSILKMREDSSLDLEDRIQTIYESHFKNSMVNTMDRVDSNKFIQYCNNTEEKVGQMESTDLIGDKNPLPEELSLGLFICEDMVDFTSPLRGHVIRIQIRNYFIYRDLADAQLTNKDPLQEYRQVQNQEGGFCDEGFNKATAYEDDGSDYSNRLLSYQECVCGPPNEESITKKMARCFAQSQNLVLVEDNQEFLERLKASVIRKNQNFEINSDNLAKVIQKKNGDADPVRLQNFLRSMCAFWFDEYYKNYLNFDSIESTYNKLIPNLESLHNDPYLELAEENQFKDVAFDDFKDISENESFVAQWFQASYSKGGHEPFRARSNSSSARHPYYQCLDYPLEFFHIENKVMVDQLDIASNATEYTNGRVFSLITQASQGAQTRVEVSKRQQTALGGRGEFRVETPKEFIGGGIGRLFGIGGKLLKDMFRASVGASAGVEAARTGSTSATEQNSNDSTKSILLAVNHVQMSLALKKYRSCFLIRPKTTAFEGILNNQWNEELKIDSFWPNAENLSEVVSEDTVFLMRVPYTHSGLLICNEESSERLVVPENYYYIHQFFGGHSYEFMSRTIYHNRPYTEIIRGREQIDRFIRLTHDITYNKEVRVENPWGFQSLINHLDQDRDQLDYNLMQAFEQYALDWSGFYKGVYTYPDLINYYDSETAEAKGLIDSTLDSMGTVIALPEEKIH